MGVDVGDSVEPIYITFLVTVIFRVTDCLSSPTIYVFLLHAAKTHHKGTGQQKNMVKVSYSSIQPYVEYC